MSAKPKKYDDDDGRVICSMDVDGLRKHDRRTAREIFAARAETTPEQMTQQEALRYTWYSVLAGLAMVFVFSAVLVVFILFCTQVWFR